MGPIMSPVLEKELPKILDKTTTVGHIKRISNKNVVFTAPTVTLWYGVCGFGTICYNNKGLAWSWCITP